MKAFIIQNKKINQRIFNFFSSDALKTYLQKNGYVVNFMNLDGVPNCDKHSLIVINLSAIYEILSTSMRFMMSNYKVIIYVDNCNISAVRNVLDLSSKDNIKICNSLLYSSDYIQPGELDFTEMPKTKFVNDLSLSIINTLKSAYIERIKRWTLDKSSKITVNLLCPQNLYNVDSNDIIKSISIHRDTLSKLNDQFDHIEFVIFANDKRLTAQDFSDLSILPGKFKLLQFTDEILLDTLECSDIVIFFDTTHAYKSIYLNILQQLSAKYDFLLILSDYTNFESSLTHCSSVNRFINLLEQPEFNTIAELNNKNLESIDLNTCKNHSLNASIPKQLASNTNPSVQLVALCKKNNRILANSFKNRFPPQVIIVDWLFRKLPLCDIWIEHNNDTTIVCKYPFLPFNRYLLNDVPTESSFDKNGNIRINLRYNNNDSLSKCLNKVNNMSQLLRGNNIRFSNLESLLYEINLETTHRIFAYVFDASFILIDCDMLLK